MTSKCKILAPIIVGGKIRTSGEVELPDQEASEHERYGRVEVLSIDGAEVQWAGCCNNNAPGN